jgi:hypothetical protein
LFKSFLDTESLLETSVKNKLREQNSTGNNDANENSIFSGNFNKPTDYYNNEYIMTVKEKHLYRDLQESEKLLFSYEDEK